MKCPICKKSYMELLSDSGALADEEGKTYETQETWDCPYCDHVITRFATYKLEKEEWE